VTGSVECLHSVVLAGHRRTRTHPRNPRPFFLSKHAQQLRLQVGRACLREAFSYDYSEIARIIRVSEVNCRQLVARGRKHLADERRASVSQAEQRRLLEAFIGAARKGDLAALEGLFASDVSSKDGIDQLFWTMRPSKLIAAEALVVTASALTGLDVTRRPDARS
jgi:hypothetical protein